MAGSTKSVALKPTHSAHRTREIGLGLKVALAAATIIAYVLAIKGAARFLGGRESPAVRVSDALPVPAFNWSFLEPSDKLNWTTCYDGHKCARLNLPLDHLSPSDGRKTAIALRLIPAKDPVNRRTIFVNPGGPGGSGTDFIAQAGTNISRILGSSFDILGFDPRGVGASTPRADCFDDDFQRQPWLYGRGERLLDLTDGSLPLIRAKGRLTAQRCEDTIGGPDGISKFMGTASVARDMLEINRQLGQEKLMYWGFSYGSVLGQYFSAMYPDQVGRVVIDGVYDSNNFRDALWDSNLADTDKVVSSFYKFCHEAGPAKCSLHSSSPGRIEARVSSALSSLKESPIAIPLSAKGPTVYTENDLRFLIFQSAYLPLTYFPILADTVAAIEAENVTALAALPKVIDPLECQCALPDPGSIPTEAFYAVACGDAEPLAYTPAGFARYMRTLERASPFAARIWGVHYLHCTEWRVRPAWRYTGALGAARTAHPLLVVSPRFDPVCPLGDAREVAARFGGARLLVQESYGHTSLAAPSVCTAGRIRAYFENGTLPEEGTVCEADELPFVGRALDGQGRPKALSVDDQELLEAIKDAGRRLPVYGF